MPTLRSRSTYWLLFVAAVILAITSMPSPASAQDALASSKWSVELGLSIDNTVELPAGIALKRHLSDRSALRFGLGFLLNSSDLEGEYENTFGGGLTGGAAIKNEQSVWSASLHYVRYGQISDRLATQLGFGPVFQYGSNFQRSSQAIGTPNFQEFESKNTETLYGLEALLGVEWFFSGRLSLGGQVGVRGLLGDATLVSTQRSSVGFAKVEVSGDEERLQTVGSRIVLTGYF